jgi:hypothetical protein
MTAIQTMLAGQYPLQSLPSQHPAHSAEEMGKIPRKIQVQI